MNWFVSLAMPLERKRRRRRRRSDLHPPFFVPFFHHSAPRSLMEGAEVEGKSHWPTFIEAELCTEGDKILHSHAPNIYSSPSVINFIRVVVVSVSSFASLFPWILHHRGKYFKVISPDESSREGSFRVRRSRTSTNPLVLLTIEFDRVSNLVSGTRDSYCKFLLPIVRVSLRVFFFSFFFFFSFYKNFWDTWEGRRFIG